MSVSIVTCGSAINVFNCLKDFNFNFLRAANKFLRTPITSQYFISEIATTANHELASSTTPHKLIEADRMAWVSPVGCEGEVVRC